MRRSNLVLLLASVFLSLVAGELVARCLVRENGFPPLPQGAEVDPYALNPFVHKYRPYLWSYIPGAHFLQVRGDRKIPIEVNSRAFRGPEIPAKQGKRLLVVGDSCTEGQGVGFASTFPVLLSDLLSANGWTAVNAGVFGASPIFYAANLPRYFGIEPDAVLLVLFENDLAEDGFREREYRQLPVLDHPEILTGHPPLPFSRLRLVELAHRFSAKNRFDPIREIVNKNTKDGAKQSVRDREFITGLPHLIGPDSMARTWSHTQRYLDYFREALARRDIPLVVTSFGLGEFPDPKVNEHHRTFVAAFNEQVRSWAALRKIPYAALQPEIDAAIQAHGTDWGILSNDGHPTAELHRFIAEALSPWLKTSLGLR